VRSLLTALQPFFPSKQTDSLKLSSQEGGVNVYRTPENRPATASDPLALACELGWGDCSHPAILPN
jgi:hypothetical protein